MVSETVGVGEMGVGQSPDTMFGGNPPNCLVHFTDGECGDKGGIRVLTHSYIYI